MKDVIKKETVGSLKKDIARLRKQLAHVEKLERLRRERTRLSDQINIKIKRQ